MNSIDILLITKYLRNPHKHIFRFEYLFMILGITLSIGIVTAGLNLFEGYQRTFRSLLLDSFAHINIYSNNNGYLSQSDIDNINKVTSSAFVGTVQKTISNNVMLKKNDQVRGCNLRAYEKSSQQWFDKYVVQGSSNIRDGKAIIGTYLSKELNIAIGDTINIEYPQFEKISPLGLIPNQRSFIVQGIYRSGYYEFDRSIILTTLKEAEEFYFLDKQWTMLEIRLANDSPSQIKHVSDYLKRELKGDYIVSNILDYNSSLFHLIEMEKWLIFIVFSFLILISGLNIVSATTAFISDNNKSLAVYSAMGASPKTLQNIIQLKIFIISVFAVLMGIVFGLVLSFLVTKQHFYNLKGDVYFIDKISYYISWVNVLATVVVASIIIYVCMMIPVKRIKSMNITEILRS